MPDVRIIVNEQGYTIKCNEGEEEKLLHYAEHFNRHVEALTKEFGHIAESRLLILAGIRVCEELFSLQGKETVDTQVALAEDIAKLATRIEHCAATINSKSAGSTKVD